MATNPLIPVSEYLSTVYRPDCDYVDGMVEERHLGERDHGKLQFAVAKLLDRMSLEWRIEVIPELRVQVSASRFRVPDVCVLSADAPDEQVVRHPPLLCIEILSPEDTISRMEDSVRDFLEMGVKQVWLFDPKGQTAVVCDGVAIIEHRAGEIALPGTPIVLRLDEVFAVLTKG